MVLINIGKQIQQVMKSGMVGKGRDVPPNDMCWFIESYLDYQFLKHSSSVKCMNIRKRSTLFWMLAAWALTVSYLLWNLKYIYLYIYIYISYLS